MRKRETEYQRERGIQRGRKGEGILNKRVKSQKVDNYPSSEILIKEIITFH